MGTQTSTQSSAPSAKALGKALTKHIAKASKPKQGELVEAALESIAQAQEKSAGKPKAVKSKSPKKVSAVKTKASKGKKPKAPAALKSKAKSAKAEGKAPLPALKPGGKAELVVKLVSRPSGATMAQLCAATGWAGCTSIVVRATRAAGLKLTREKSASGKTVYKAA